MCTEQLPLGGYPIAVKYIISCNILRDNFFGLVIALTAAEYLRITNFIQRNTWESLSYIQLLAVSHDKWCIVTVYPEKKILTLCLCSHLTFKYLEIKEHNNKKIV
jgi:hypothetical protein